MSQRLTQYLNIAITLAREGGKIINNFNYTPKNNNLLAETDKKIRKLLINGIKTEFPDHKFFDKNQLHLTDDSTWIINPISGVSSFIHGFPHSCISIALCINKEPQVAVVYNPILEELYTAQKGHGATLNGIRPLKVCHQNELFKTLLMFESGTVRNPDKMQAIFKNFETLTPQVQGIRALGTAALDMAMVALGTAGAYFEFGTNIWDTIAGELLVTEAGGVVMDPTGAPLHRFSRKILCASNKRIAEELISKLIQYYPNPKED